MRKVNVDTDLRLVSTDAIRRFLVQSPSELDLRRYFFRTVKAICDICIAYYEALDIADSTSKIRLASLEGIFQRYARGELDPKAS